MGYTNVELIQAVLLAFAVVVILMPAYIRFLRYVGMGKRILVEGPESHQVKEGTPTMGGLLLIGVVIALFFFLNDFILPPGGIIAPLATL
ncbi:MAG: phospho-N-acetylmuramoyl-pentapeptide-transferase, partial [Gaiellales bacterium]